MKKSFLTIVLAGVIAFSYTLTANADVSISVDVNDNGTVIEQPKKSGLFGIFHRKDKKPVIKNEVPPKEPVVKKEVKAPNVKAPEVKAPDVKKDVPVKEPVKKK